MSANGGFSLRDAQRRHRQWAIYNFGEHPAWQPLLGVVEELGELAHAHLKAEQGIRTTEDHSAAKRDAVADIVIYLMDYCSCEGIDLESTLEEVHAAVLKRDWKKSPGAAHELA